MKGFPFNSWFITLIALTYLFIQDTRAVIEQSLPITPTCGSSSSKTSVNYNFGIQLDKISTIYVFGDSLSANGNHRGGTPPPPQPQKEGVLYGGRATNGLMWNEVLLTKNGSKVSSYAVGGAVIDKNLYHNLKPSVVDMVEETQNYLVQNRKIEPETTLTSIYFGVNDYSAATKEKLANQLLPKAAEEYLEQTKKLIESGMAQFLILTPPMDRPAFSEHNDIIWNGMLEFQKSHNITFAHVQMSELFQKLDENPGLFKFDDTKSCLVSSKSLDGSCSNPDEHPYWIPAHPSARMQEYIAEYVTKVIEDCKEGKSNSHKHNEKNKY
ncbi:hypothetical protein CROQUDRAFT_522529 [Cronartium quercuum f. sp. fusiforme G11]|uniref:Uncharacterized protein n=1 Tax=Cronartium quercuum f. sp. fusiforme G11 TaxID=708437 RepID=A0A9P6N7G6_9BASI|nr:hypothetical protein CROQUDRAFT_522529 [Cronartium quercuum f. sp. fusiforme G11]